MGKKKVQPNYRRRTLRLPDLDHSKLAVLNSLGSPGSRRVYEFALNQFIAWYCSEPRLAFNRIVVTRYRMHLESRGLAANTINQQLAAVRRIAHEAADAGLLRPELAAGISRVRGVKQLGFRVGNWLSADECSAVLSHAHGTSLRAKRDYAMLAMLFGCGLRRSELVGLDVNDMQVRQGHWAVVDRQFASCVKLPQLTVFSCSAYLLFGYGDCACPPRSNAMKHFLWNVTRLLICTAVMVGAVGSSAAQTAGGSGEELRQKVAAIKQSAAENQQKLRQYQWTETTQLTLKGNPKPPKQSLCQYGPDGQVQKTPIGGEAPPPNGGKIKKRIVEKKKEEMQDYMGQVKTLLAEYTPPDPQKIEQALKAGNASLNPNLSAQTVGLVMKNYAQPGDQMTLSFNSATKKVSGLKVDTYLEDPKNTVTLAVKMASLPDGTNYVQQTVLDATAKQLQVTTTNSNYQKMGGQ